MLGFSPFLLQAFSLMFSSMLGFAPELISCISFYNIFFNICFTRDRTRSMLLERLALRLGGWAPKNDSTWLLWLAQLVSSGARHRKTTDANSCEDWRRERFYAVCHDFGSFIPNLGIWIQGSWAMGHVSSTAYFSKNLEDKDQKIEDWFDP